MLNSAQIQNIAMQSPFPASTMIGNGWLYFTSLTSLWFMACVSAIILVKKIKELWADRKYSKWNAPVTAWRLIVACWMITALVRNMPEVLYLMSFGEVSAYTSSLMLYWKRIMDTFAPLSFMTGVSLIVLADEQISFFLRQPMMKASFDLTNRKEKVKDLLYLLGGVTLMSGIFWAAKYFNHF